MWTTTIRFSTRRARAIVLLCTGLLVVLGRDASALDPNRTLTQYIHRIWQVQQGLPHTTVYAIHQSSDGYLWLGTQAGLARFDGLRFTLIREWHGVAIGTPWVTRIVEDADHNLWVGTKDAGLFRLNKEGARHWKLAESKSASATIDALCVDATHRVWIASASGLYVLDHDRLITPSELGISLVFQAICPAADGKMVVAEIDGKCWELSPGLEIQSVFEAKSRDASTQVTCMIADGDDGFWIGTTNGLTHWTPMSQRTLTTAEGLAGNHILTIERVRNGNLWVGTKNGISRIDGDDIENYGTREGLSQSAVHAIFQDREENIWVGTKNGLNQFADRRIVPFTTNEGLPSNDVGPVVPDRGDAIWIGTERNGLARYDGRRFHAMTTGDGLLDDRVTTLANAAQGGLWIGTESGLQRYDQEKFGARYTIADGLPGGRVQSVLDVEATTWIGTSAGLAMLSEGKIVPSDAPQLHGKSILAIAPCGRGKVILSTEQDGVFLQTDDGFRSLKLGDASAPTCDALFTDVDGLVWIGTRGAGLFLFDGEHVTRFSIKDGLFDDDLYGIAADDQDRLWMACGKGIFAVPRTALRHRAAGIDAAPLRCEPFSPTEAQRTIECRPGIQPAVSRASDGKIWFSTIRGLIVVDTQNLARRLPLLPVVIEETLADGRAYGSTETLRLPAGSSNLSFQYAALGFQSPARITFRYMLEGFNTDWIEAGTRREATYANLAPGEYRFRVAATNVDGQSNEAARPIAIRIVPYVYQRGWFAPACIFGAIVIGWIAYRLRVDAVRKRGAAIVNERGRIARELHDTLLQGFSGVTMEMQALGARMAATPEREELQGIIADAALCLREARHSVAGLRDRDAQPSDLPAKLTATAQRIVDERVIRLRTRFSRTPIGLSADVEYQLLRIVQEALSNAVKHSQATAIELTLESVRREILVSVSDDGVGFTTSDTAAAERFGLLGMRERAKQIGAALDVRSVPGAGTTVTVSLPKTKSHSANGAT